MGVKETLLSGLKPVLTHTIKSGMAEGKLVQPVDFAVTSENVWKHLRTNIQTAGALMAFRIKREEIDQLLREVFKDLKVEVKDDQASGSST